MLLAGVEVRVVVDEGSVSVRVGGWVLVGQGVSVALAGPCTAVLLPVGATEGVGWVGARGVLVAVIKSTGRVRSAPSWVGVALGSASGWLR